MRALGLISVAGALCVCCVLPSYDAVDRLPSEGEGATSATGPTSNSGGKSNLTSASGGKTSSSGSDSGAEGGEDPMGTSGSQGTGGSEAGGSGGASTNGGTANGGTPPTGGMAGGGSPATGGAAGQMQGGQGGSGPAGGNGGQAGTGGTPSTGCMKLCSGADSIGTVCAAEDIDDSLKTSQSCYGRCSVATAANISCWQAHVTNAKNGSPDVHCSHAAGEAVCSPWPSP